jgi:gluconokinase
MQPYLLGVDIGTGSTKAIAVGFNGNIIHVAQRHYAAKTPQPGYNEQDPEIILAAFNDCIQESIEKCGHPPHAVSFSSAMHSVIPVDHNGKALAAMMTWADARSESIAQNLRESAQAEGIYKTGGTPIHAMTPLCKIIWLKANLPDVFNTAYKFIGIKEYIWFHLFNVFEVDYAIASATALFDILKLQWNDEACAIAGITAQKLSVPVDTVYKRSGLIPAAAGQLKLDNNVTFVMGASDGCCANLGSFVTGPGIGAITIGTSGAVRITSPRPVYNFEAMVFNYLLDKQTFVCGGAVNNGGIALQWLLKTFLNTTALQTDDYETAFKAIDGIKPGSDGLIFLPYLYGERAPIWDTKSCGVFFNIKPAHTRAHFLRAGLEGICMALRDVLLTLEASSAPVVQINISGGFITSAVWTQTLADITGKKLVIAQHDDASAIGAVFLAMQALSIVLPVNIFGNNAPVIVTDADRHHTYQKYFDIYKRLYHDLKDTMHLSYSLD